MAGDGDTAVRAAFPNPTVEGRLHENRDFVYLVMDECPPFGSFLKSLL